jgi:hypothetical protein
VIKAHFGPIPPDVHSAISLLLQYSDVHIEKDSELEKALEIVSAWWKENTTMKWVKTGSDTYTGLLVPKDDGSAAE